ncbi:MAG: CPBP family intramembrane metalloprotease, partial [Lachnospiraceae bacterium]|nr:CPBP family intramembrane metalloprotease [Lachnospiraceae bacterium]
CILQKGRLEMAETFGLCDVITVLFVGLTEEMVFRGWLLNATITEKRKWWQSIPMIKTAIFPVKVPG